MSQTVSPSTSRSYGLARVSPGGAVRAPAFIAFSSSPMACDRPSSPRSDGPCPDADLADHIRREIEASDFHGEGYRKLWARLRVAGVRSSPRRVRRVMGENRLLAPHRVGRNRERRTTESIVTDKVNEMWGTDMSQTVTLNEGQVLCFRRRVTRRTAKSSGGTPRVPPPNRFEALERVRGVYSVLRLHRARRGACGSTAWG